jgi:hypothetical protein
VARRYIEAARARSHDAEVELEVVEIWIFEGGQYAVDALFAERA